MGRCHTAPLRAPHTQHHAHILQWTQCALHVFLCSSLALKTSPGLSPGCHESPTGTQVSSSVSASPDSSPGPGTEKACLPPRTAIQQGHQGSGSDSTGTSWDTGVTESEAQFCEGCLQDSAWHPSFPSSPVLPHPCWSDPGEGQGPAWVAGELGAILDHSTVQLPSRGLGLLREERTGSQ